MIEAVLVILAMIAIVGLRYLAVSGAFSWVTARMRPGLYGGARMKRQISAEIRWSLVAAAIYGVPAGIVLYLWQAHGMSAIYTDPAAYPLWWIPVSLLLYLLLHDTYFYWTHRAMHTPALFSIMHRVHHDSRPPSAWAAMSFHPWESLSGAIIIPVLTFIIPIHVGALGLVLAIMTVFGVTNHLGWEIFPRTLVNATFGKIMITASHHHQHHSNYRCNFGLYFRLWDRLCGTDRGLGEFDDA